MEKLSYEQIADKLAESHDTTRSQMFGKKCLKYQGKAFAAFHEECMIFKLGKEWIVQNADNYPQAENWDPSGKGRPMKDWLKMPETHSNEWFHFSKQALNFIQ